ncbi:mitochondrial import inner membrane translocase subunit Tim10-like [Sycon ciliatum]|uniref:mitochondrial import inner membrane translocase subunit Tim10-like n=1 Tax=Sycon ciliatum TaxID=27933 RepID=UPI0020AB9EC4
MDANQQRQVADLEVEVMTDMYSRLTQACHTKCIPAKYREGDITKGEAVCLDRCVAKYLEIHESIGKKLTSMYMDEEAMKRQMQASGKM